MRRRLREWSRSDVAIESVCRGQRIGGVAGNALADAAVGIDGGRDAVVGVAQNPAAVFDGTHARHVQVLPGGAGVAVPSIVRDVDEHLGAELGELPHLIGKNGLVADEDAVAMAVQAEDLALVAAIEARDLAGELAGKEEQTAEGQYSPKGTR